MGIWGWEGCYSGAMYSTCFSCKFSSNNCYLPLLSFAYTFLNACLLLSGVSKEIGKDLEQLLVLN